MKKKTKYTSIELRGGPLDGQIVSVRESGTCKYHWIPDGNKCHIYKRIDTTPVEWLHVVTWTIESP